MRARRRSPAATGAEVLGQNFWANVAPCTDVASFRGRLDALAQKGGGTESFDFDFMFPWWRRSVRIRILVNREARWVFVNEMA